LLGDDGFNLLFDTAHWCTSPLWGFWTLQNRPL